MLYLCGLKHTPTKGRRLFRKSAPKVETKLVIYDTDNLLIYEEEYEKIDSLANVTAKTLSAYKTENGIQADCIVSSGCMYLSHGDLATMVQLADLSEVNRYVVNENLGMSVFIVHAEKPSVVADRFLEFVLSLNGRFYNFRFVRCFVGRGKSISINTYNLGTTDTIPLYMGYNLDEQRFEISILNDGYIHIMPDGRVNVDIMDLDGEHTRSVYTDIGIEMSNKEFNEYIRTLKRQALFQ